MSSPRWTSPAQGLSQASTATAAEYATRWPLSSRCATSLAPRSAPAGAAAQESGGQLSLLPLLAPTGPVDAEDVERLRAQLLQIVRASRRGRGAQLELTVTNNHSTMISVRRGQGCYRLRLHRMFLTAGLSTLGAIGRYVTDNDSSASAELSEFIDAHQVLLPPRPAPAPRVQRILHEGQHHNLLTLFEQLNGRYFGGQIEARITWGRVPRRTGRPRRHRSLKLGSYSVEDRLIRIHPTLDHTAVPGYFVEWIVYHEMLHQKHPIPTVAGRRQFHTPAFLAEERLFADYERARQWERRNLHRLLVF